MILYYIPLVRRLLLELQRLAFSLVHGSSVGKGTRVFGWPIVTKARNSTLLLGDSVTLVSSNYFSEPGVSGPCVLRTLCEGAVLFVGSESGLSGASICAALSVKIGERCLLGADTMVMDTDFHPVAAPGRRYRREGTRVAPVAIGDNVFIGARCIVLKGSSIGDDCVIGAGSVVCGDIPAGSVAAGVPARVVGRVDQHDSVSDST